MIIQYYILLLSSSLLLYLLLFIILYYYYYTPSSSVILLILLLLLFAIIIILLVEYPTLAVRPLNRLTIAIRAAIVESPCIERDLRPTPRKPTYRRQKPRGANELGVQNERVVASKETSYCIIVFVC